MPNVTNFILRDQQIDIEDTAARTAASNAQTTATAAQKTATKAQTTAENAQTTSNQATQNINNIIPTVNILKRRITPKSMNVVMIGDSYGVDYYQSGSGASYQTQIKSLSIFNNVYKYAISGAGFAAGNTTFIDILNNINDISDTSTIDMVVVAGGWNDRTQNRGDILTGIQSFCTACRNKFPNAEIKVAHIGWGTNTSQFTYLYTSIYAYRDCSRYGAIYIENSEYILHTSYFTLFNSDGIHPNSTGQTTLARYLSSGMISNFCLPAQEWVSMNIEANSGFKAPTIYCMMEQSKTFFKWANQNMSGFTSLNSNGNPAQNIAWGSINYGCIMGVDDIKYTIPVFAHNSSGWTQVTMCIYFSQRYLRFGLGSVLNSGYVKLGDIDQLYLSAFNGCIDTLNC